MCRMVDSSGERVKIALTSLQIFTDHSQAPGRGPRAAPASLPQELQSVEVTSRTQRKETNALMFERNIRAQV